MHLYILDEPEPFSEINTSNYDNLLERLVQQAIQNDLPITNDIKRKFVTDAPFLEAEDKYCFKVPPHPWLSPDILKQIDRMKKMKLNQKEIINLLGRIAKISMDYYDLKCGNVVAIKIDCIRANY